MSECPFAQSWLLLYSSFWSSGGGGTQVFPIGLMGKTYAVDVGETDTVATLRERIARAMEADARDLRLSSGVSKKADLDDRRAGFKVQARSK